jgi:hypothetical protein
LEYLRASWSSRVRVNPLEIGDYGFVIKSYGGIVKKKKGEMMSFLGECVVVILAYWIFLVSRILLIFPS